MTSLSIFDIENFLIVMEREHHKEKKNSSKTRSTREIEFEMSWKIEAHFLFDTPFMVEISFEGYHFTQRSLDHYGAIFQVISLCVYFLF